jgi:hypothetical protein
MIYVLGVIPLWHRLSRIRPAEKLEEWAGRLKGYEYADPQALADQVLMLLNGVCVLGFVGVAIWMVIHFLRWQRLAAFPALWLGLMMILFQNVNTLYFWYPRQEKQFNMHTLFWVLWSLMVLYVIVSPLFRPAPAKERAEGEPEPPFRYVAWFASAVVSLALFIFVAGFVNGEETMKSANTRWPQWVWKEGPFPRDKAP